MAAPLSGISPPLLLFAASSLWGMATVLNKVLLGSVAPIPLLILQLLASVTVLWSVWLWRCLPLPRGALLATAIGLGALNPGVSYTFNLMGLERTSASVTALLWATEPFLILVLARIILGQPITRGIMAVIVLGFAGVVLVSGVTVEAEAAPTDLVGIGYLIVAVLICAVYTVMSRGIGDGVDALVLVMVQQTAGLAWAVGLGIVTIGTGLVSEVRAIPPATVAAAMASGLLYYATAYWLYLSALSRVSAALAGGSFNLIPVVAVILAYIVLGERLEALQWAGAGLILTSGVALFWMTRTPSAAV